MSDPNFGPPADNRAQGQPPSPFTELPKKKSKLPLILGIIGVAVVGFAVAAVMIFSSIVSSWGGLIPKDSDPAPAPDVTQEQTLPAEATPEKGVYPENWGDAPFLPYQTVDLEKTDADVLADIRSKLRGGDSFPATDEELLNTAKSFCWAYEKGESWGDAAVQFMMLGEKAGLDADYSDLAYNANIIGYAGAHFYCPRYEGAIRQEIEDARAAK